MTRVVWPDGKRFAFTVFDDPDNQNVANGKPVYDLLAGLGLRTTKGVWPLRSRRLDGSGWGQSCEDPEYVAWCLELREQGFELALHCAAPATSTRAETIAGFDAFVAHFGLQPTIGTNHYGCDENIYWGASRLSGARRVVYSAAMLGRRPPSFGHDPASELFWGDVCRDRVRYFRNFVFRDIDTLRACPYMPYHDPARPFVNAWFASSEGGELASFVAQISEERQDELEERGGACIMYTHFGHGFVEDGKVESRFRSLLERLAAKGGWFVPVSELLDHLRGSGTPHVITPGERRELETRWLREKLRYGTA